MNEAAQGTAASGLGRWLPTQALHSPPVRLGMARCRLPEGERPHPVGFWEVAGEPQALAHSTRRETIESRVGFFWEGGRSVRRLRMRHKLPAAQPLSHRNERHAPQGGRVRTAVTSTPTKTSFAAGYLSLHPSPRSASRHASRTCHTEAHPLPGELLTDSATCGGLCDRAT